MNELELTKGYVMVRHYYKRPSGLIVKPEAMGTLERCILVVGINDEVLEVFGDIVGRCVVISSSYMSHGEIVEVDGGICMILPVGSVMAVYNKVETEKMLKKYTATAEEISKTVSLPKAPIVSPAQA